MRSIHGPERLRDQGIGLDQAESAERAILALLTDAVVHDQVDLVATWRRGHTDANSEGAYEVWSNRGMVRFQRLIEADGGIRFEVIEVVGENPIANQRTDVLRSLDAEKQAALASGFDAEDPARRFIRAEYQSYPYGYERIAQLFDSPNAPDLVVSPNDWAFGLQPGTHGALHVRQARAPLWISGTGIAPGLYDRAARAVDIAPTVLSALGFPLIDGRDATGRTSSERGASPDVVIARQDGEVIEEIIDRTSPTSRYLYIFLLDGLHATELEDRLATDPVALPHIRRLRERAAIFQSGSIVNFPSITWPSHTTIGTGTWCGHHDVINPSYYLRDKREMISPQGQQVNTEGFSNPDVESIYEAFARVRGRECLSAAIYAPFGRGADHAVLESRNLCRREHLIELNAELSRDQNPRWRADGHEDIARESILDSRGVAQLHDLFERGDIRSPDFVFHELILTDGVGHDYGPHSEGLRDALDESDRRIGRILDLLESQGRFDETLFVLTSDHGMAPQDTRLAANPGRIVLAAGMAARVADSMIWLIDVALEIERASDGRTGRVIVRTADALPSGDCPPVAGARIRVVATRRGHGAEEIAAGESDAGGIFGFATPAEIPSHELVLHVDAEGFNPRTVRLDASRVGEDLRTVLYPAH